jgi:hypothetical protein
MSGLIFKVIEGDVHPTMSVAALTFDSYSSEFGGETPKAAIIYGMEATTVDTTDSDMLVSIGYLDADDNRNVVSTTVADAVGGTPKRAYTQVDDAITGQNHGVLTLISSTDGSIYQDYDAELVANGIKFTNLVGSGTTTVHFQVLLIGGDEVLNAKVMSQDAFNWFLVGNPYEHPTSAIGFQPNLIFAKTAKMDPVSPWAVKTTESSISCGVAGDHKGLGVIKQNAMGLYHLAAGATTVLGGAVRDDAIIVSANQSGTDNLNYSIDSITRDGVTWSWSSGGGQNMHILYIELIQAQSIYIGQTQRGSGNVDWTSGDAADSTLVYAQLGLVDGVHTANTNESTGIGTFHISITDNTDFFGFTAQNEDGVSTTDANMLRTAGASWRMLEAGGFSQSTATISVTGSNELSLASSAGWQAYTTAIPYLLIAESVPLGPKFVDSGVTESDILKAVFVDGSLVEHNIDSATFVITGPTEKTIW